MRPLEVFLIQPFMRDYSETLREWVLEACKSLQEARPQHQFHCARVDAPDEILASPRLQDRIEEKIKKSDICIADMTYGEIKKGDRKETRNENVLLEVGASYALQKPVIPICQPNRSLPSDVNGNLFIPLYLPSDFAKMGKKGLKKVSSDATLTGETSSGPMEMFLKQKEEFLRELKRRLLESQMLKVYLPSQSIVYGFQYRKLIDFRTLIERSTVSIKILTTNLDFINKERFPSRVGQNDPENETLLQMLSRFSKDKSDEFNIQILALDPDSNFANDRAKDLRYERRPFRENLQNNLKEVEDFVKRQNSGQWSLAIYEATPFQMTFLFDDYVVASVVSEQTSSRLCMAYFHHLDIPGARLTYENHFDNLRIRSTIKARSQQPLNRRATDKPSPCDETS